MNWTIEKSTIADYYWLNVGKRNAVYIVPDGIILMVRLTGFPTAERAQFIGDTSFDLVSKANGQGPLEIPKVS